MSDVLSAGTVVGAVLETAGFMTQQRILHDFDKFFDYTGAHLFTIAGFAGLCAIVIFGSFRMARYMLLGPFLFYILIEPRATIDGVWWSLGNRKPVNTRMLAEEAINKEKKKIEQQEGSRGPIEVSKAFEAYTRTVSELVNTVVQFVLRYHNDGDYLFFGRRYALDILVNALPQRARTLHIVYDQFIVGQCSDMMNVSLALAQKSLSRYQMMHYQEMLGQACGSTDPRNVDQWLEDARRGIRARLEEKRRDGQSVRLNDQEIDQQAQYALNASQEQCRRVRQRILQTVETIQYLQLEYEEIAKTKRTTIDPETAQFIISYWNEDSTEPEGQKRYTINTIPELQAIYGGDETKASSLAGQSISCGAMWDVASNAILAESALLLHHVEKMLFGSNAQPIGVTPNVSATGDNAREVLCRELVKKMGGQEAGMFEDSEVLGRRTADINGGSGGKRALVRASYGYLQEWKPTQGPNRSHTRTGGGVHEVAVVRTHSDGQLTVLVPSHDRVDAYDEVTGYWEVVEWLNQNGAREWSGQERWASIRIKKGRDGKVIYGPDEEGRGNWEVTDPGQFEVIQVKVKGRSGDKYIIEGPTTYNRNGTFGPVEQITTSANIVEWGEYITSSPPTSDVRRCDLVQATALYLLRNMISYTPHGRAATSVKLRAGFSRDFRGIRAVAPQGAVDESGKPREDGLVISYGEAQPRYRIDEGRTIQEIAIPKLDENGQQIKDQNGNVVVEWRPFYEIESDGHLSAAYAIHQKYQTEYLRQGLFTWAMNLPYYQGCLLYFLAIAYPFMALIVVMPNKAVAFLNLPLAWLWVKSWDIGFAITMVVEKILWNNLPHARTAYDPMMQPYSEDGRIMTGIPLPDLIQTAFSADPAYNVHAHFNYLTMVLFSVPVISGYLIMKGKHAALASFVDGPKDAADDAGQIGQGRYGVTMMNEKITAMKRGEGLTLNKYRGQGRGAGGRFERGLIWGGIAASQSLIPTIRGSAAAVSGETLNKQTNFSEDGVEFGSGVDYRKQGLFGRSRAASRVPANQRKAVEKGVETINRAIGTTYNITNREDDFAAYYDLAYGSFKEHRKRQGAIFAAMDAFGEHEMTHFLEGRGALKKEMALFEEKLKITYGVLNSFVQGTIEDRRPWITTKGGGAGFAEMSGKAVVGFLFQAYGQQWLGNNLSEKFPWNETQRERWTLDSAGNYRIIRDRDLNGYYSLIPGTTHEDNVGAADRVSRAFGGMR